ncbi:MAG: asparagine synthase (glutamine-hydrolyzing) [SAR324 cluster bacterium]|nr:asparagine synthase (glutamine-hydrolyzing) [SAR324 cluster bacterium]
MCGIAGFMDFSGRKGKDALEALAAGMARAIRHRGPDGHGVWSDPECGLAFGHRRLSIIDLSHHGHQPMSSASGRYVLTYNGEIYNFQSLRRELEALGHPFRGHSDTEVMLTAFDQWGVTDALPRLNGMFAFAVWDRQERLLRIARDRLGEKPLYYGWQNNVLFFASELKAIRAYPGFAPKIDRDALTLFFRYNYIPSPYSIFQGIRKLPPASSAVFSAREGPNSPGHPVAYWNFPAVASQGELAPFTGSEAELAAELETLLTDAVGLRMVADVPLGAFLSGGIDSSTIVALMQAQSMKKVRTFSIGFHEKAFNEAGFAKDVASHLGTDHTELYVSPSETRDVIARLPQLYDEPFSDSSQIPTFLVSQLARRHVTVGMTGDGGDELFGGYNRYLWAPRLGNIIDRMPGSLRDGLALLLTGPPPWAWNAFLKMLGPVMPRKFRVSNPEDKLHKLAALLRFKKEMYFGLVSNWKDPEAVVVGGNEPPTPLTDASSRKDFSDARRRMMYLDTLTYLPDDILAKVDRASMGVSLETRIPLLDHRVVEFAWRVPTAMKFRDGNGKWLLRQVLHKFVPRELIERPKMGFGVPIGDWLRGPLRDWAEALLDPERIRSEGYLNARPIQEKWRAHLTGSQNWQYLLWGILMFQCWHENLRSSEGEMSA